ncbi:hypothetical protein PflCFBP13514_08860 [Pseudomonas fluorescens]|nr:hypothetical protein PflCFBP13514_08860 [Pseudomonas fluorescens]
MPSATPDGKSAHNQIWELACVGAGLPAMQTPRSLSQTEVMLSQASQLLHGSCPHWMCSIRPGS